MSAANVQQANGNETEWKRAPATQGTVRRFEPSGTTVNVDRSGIRNAWSAVAANLFVVVVPALAAWALAPGDGPEMAIVSMSVAVALSAATAALGSAVWRRRPTCSELVFSDLMLWGWLRRVRTERRLAQARSVLVLDASCHPATLVDHQLEDLKRVSGLIDAQDRYTRGHSLRVTRHAEGIARALRLPACEVAKLRTAAALHDIGKIHTPRAILQKPGRLTDEEFAVIKRHPGDGAAMLSALKDPAIAAMIRHHHERLDGSGYPDALVGEEIPLGARIIAVADTFDAMTSHRSYRGAFEHKKALDVLTSEAGSRLDAAAVSAFHAYYSGKNLAAWSTLVTTAVPRLVACLGSRAQVVTGAAPTLGKALPTIGAAAVMASPVGSPDLGREGSDPPRATAVAGQPARSGSWRRQAPGIPSLHHVSPSPARREPKRSSHSRRPVKRKVARPQGETDSVAIGRTRSPRSDPSPVTVRLPLPVGRNELEVSEPGSGRTPPLPESLTRLASVERAGVRRLEPAAPERQRGAAAIQVPAGAAVAFDIAEAVAKP